METGAALGTTTGDRGILVRWAGDTLQTVCLFFPSDPSPLPRPQAPFKSRLLQKAFSHYHLPESLSGAS